MSTAARTGAHGALALRPATEADVPSIREIEVESFSDPWSAASFRSMLGQPQVLATVAERDGAIVGYSIAWAVGDEAELANLAVAPLARSAGIGGALVDALLATLEARGGATVYLEVRSGNDEAQTLYRRRGFVASGRRKGYYRHPTEDAVIMRRARAEPVRPD